VTPEPPDPGPDPVGATRLDALDLVPYRLALRHPWRSARGLLRERRGWLARARSDGVHGYGDCTPLAEAGTELMGAAHRALQEACERLPGLPIESALRRRAPGSAMAPAASHAVECALLDLQSRLAGVPLRRWILRAPGGTASDWIEVNGALGPAIQVTGEAVARALDSGYRVLKVKVGCADPDAEIAHLVDLASALPAGAGLRLDANGAWDLETAQRVIAACADLPIESLEEPLKRPDPEGLARLQALAPFPLALDESLVHWTGPAGARPLPVRRAVIKPAALGGVAASLRVAERLGRLGIEIVLTGMLESAAGLWATAQLAAAVGSPLAHGLATGSWLAQDLGPPPMPSMGRLHLPDCPGSGFEQLASQ